MLTDVFGCVGVVVGVPKSGLSYVMQGRIYQDPPTLSVNLVETLNASCRHANVLKSQTSVLAGGGSKRER